MTAEGNPQGERSESIDISLRPVGLQRDKGKQACRFVWLCISVAWQSVMSANAPPKFVARPRKKIRTTQSEIRNQSGLSRRLKGTEKKGHGRASASGHAVLKVETELQDYQKYATCYAGAAKRARGSEIRPPCTPQVAKGSRGVGE